MENRNFLTSPRGIFLVAMVCCLLWGSAFPCVKIGYELFQLNTDHIPTLLLYAGIRFAVAGVLGILVGSVLRKRFIRPVGAGWRSVIVTALIQTVMQYVFYYIGFSNTTGAKGSIICASNTFFSILFACFLFRQEKFTGRKAIGCILGFAGVVLVNLTGSGLGGGFSLTGEGFIFCSSASYALSSVLMRVYGQKEDPVTISAYQFLLGGFVLMVIGQLLGGEIVFHSVSCYLLIIYLSFVSTGAFTLWSILVKYNPVSKVAIFSMMTPVFGVTLSTIFLREGSGISWVQYLCALVLVCLGIWTINRPDKRKA